MFYNERTARVLAKLDAEESPEELQADEVELVGGLSPYSMPDDETPAKLAARYGWH